MTKCRSFAVYEISMKHFLLFYVFNRTWKSGSNIFISTVYEQGFEGHGARASLDLRLMHSFIYINKADVCKIPDSVFGKYLLYVFPPSW
jgi:hypothetical protein